jgi:ABC-type branched-subunit amino acid transport system substrate-binding protein
VNGSRLPICLWAITVHCLLLTACAVTRPIVKIGLVAPFEGRYREVGYEVIYATRLAVREANAAGGVAGYSVELVALDDGGDPELAAEQARKLATDPQVIGVIGHWLNATTNAAALEYDQLGIPLLDPISSFELPASVFRLRISPCHYALANGCYDAWAEAAPSLAAGDTLTTVAPLPVDSTNPDFANRYRAISNGIEPRFNAVLAYDATRLLLDAIARDVTQNNTATRGGVAEALAHAEFSGLTGTIQFDADRERLDAPSWTYVWREGTLIKP